MKTILLSVLIITGFGCASVGNKIDRAGADRIKVGDSKQDVLAAIGKPDGVGRDAAKGQEVWTYIHLTQTMKPETLIPFAGAFIGGVDTSTDTVTVFFDQDGKVSNVNTSFATAEAKANTISDDRKSGPKLAEEKPAHPNK